MFQSTPAITGGRDESSYAFIISLRVSIHARHYWRARPSARSAPCACASFQSTPAITGGRDVDSIVTDPPYGLFQSTPAITGGRDPLICRSALWPSWFQSTPAITGGRDAGRVAVQQRRTVSIHARHYWRARPLAEQADRQHRLFQSTPAITGGRDSAIRRLLVLAQCFNPRPPLLAGETPADIFYSLIGKMFQSTPAITGGRDSSTFGFRVGRLSFNPRPPLLAGETGLIDAQHLHKAGFNPRPPLLAGETFFSVGVAADGHVSIHARHYWRARHQGDPLLTQ